MLLVRIALLPSDGPDMRLGIGAVDSSLSFYRRFGFKAIGRFAWPDGNRYTVATKEGVHAGLIEFCRKTLAEAQIRYPMSAIPYSNEPNKAPEPTPGAVTPRATEGDSK
jgi:hypothetical protein